MLLQTNTLSVGKCQQSVVVHDTVHVLDPQSVNIRVVQNPSNFFLSFREGLVHGSKYLG